jgi:hypothetical protein
LKLQETGIYFTTGHCSIVDTPFLGDGGEGLGANIGIHGGECYTQWQTGVGANEVLGGVVGKEVVTEGSERFVVEIDIRVS